MNQDTPNNLHDIIKNRWSPRAFSDELITDGDLQALLQAARWAPSSMNEQPWHYLIAKRGTAGFEKMVDALVEANQVWAKNASHLMIALAKKHFDYKNRVNRHHMHDVGAANVSMMIQGASMGIYGHMMGGFKSEVAHESFAIDQEVYEIACFIALGKDGNAEKLDEKLREREQAPRKRNAIETIFTDLS